MKTLGVIVPYRNREANLRVFLPTIQEYLTKKAIPYKIIIVEQTKQKQFNRGLLMNVGFLKLEHKCDYFVFHDVDLIPINEECFYTYPTKPTHIAAHVEQFEYNFSPDYYGGVCLFNKENYVKINGFSNNYWGWGGEDNDLNLRVLYKGLTWERKPGTYKSLKHRRLYWDSKRKISLHPFFGLNRARYIKMRVGLIDQDADGLNQTKYVIVSESKISERVSSLIVKI